MTYLLSSCLLKNYKFIGGGKEKALHFAGIERGTERQEMEIGTTKARRSVFSSPPAECAGAETLAWPNDRTQGVPFLTKNHDIAGREHELELLNDCYDRITTTKSTEAVTIHGPPGAGKTTLLQTFIRSLPADVFYMEGRFDQLQSRAPYAALAAACEQLCRQIMQREDYVEIFARIRAALGPEVRLLGNLVPTLAKMTTMEGSSAVQHTCGAHLFTRLKLLFRAFLGCVASPESPVVFFLDDLQWADDAPLEILKTLLSSGQLHCVMIVCAYREGEMTEDVLEQYGLARIAMNSSMDDSHNSLGSSSRRSCGITDISVQNLDCGSLNQLISNMLVIDAQETQSLSTLVWNKTDGNPFHALCFLDMLHRSGMLSNGSDSTWTWDEDQILQGTNLPGTLADILVSRMQGLPQQVRSILQIASCVGHAFPATLLVMIVHEEQDLLEAEYSFERHSVEVIRERIAAALEIGIAEGLLKTMPEANHFKFVHDKIQEALYEGFMPDEMERQLLHQRIGKMIWDSVEVTSLQTDDWYVFLAANNLNRAVGIVDNSGIRYDMIDINRIAATRAIEKDEFGAAAEYLRIAVSLLHGDRSLWDDRYEQWMEVLIHAAETEKNVGIFSRSNVLVKEIHSRATALRHHCAAYAVEMESLAVQGDPMGAVHLGLKVLRHLGVKLPRNINRCVVATELLRAKAALGRRSLPELLLLPEMQDESMMLALGFMNAIALNCCLVGGPLKATNAVVGIRMFRLTIMFGISPLYSPAAFSFWGSLHAILGDFEVAQQAVTLALRVVDKYAVESVRAWMVIFNYGIHHFWRNTLDSNKRQEFLDGYRMALTYGHVFIAQTGYIAWVAAAFYLDDSLTELNTTTRRAVQKMREWQSKSILVILRPLWQVFLNMSGDARNLNPASLQGEAVDQHELKLMQAEVDSQVAVLTESVCLMKLGFLYEDWETVKKNLPVVRRYKANVKGYFTIGVILTFTAACHYDIYHKHRISKHKREGRRAHRKVNKWAVSGTDMLVGPNCFLRAMECFCVERMPLNQVEIRFGEAASACAARRCRLFEALSNERLAKLFLIEKSNVKHLKYLKRACDLYRSWGAEAKADWLEQRHRSDPRFL